MKKFHNSKKGNGIKLHTVKEKLIISKIDGDGDHITVECRFLWITLKMM